jgi:hypothetical protein
MWFTIDMGSQSESARLDARAILSGLEKKLELATRTRPLPKANIFGIVEDQEDTVELPKQQRFMERFLGRAKPTDTS